MSQKATFVTQCSFDFLFENSPYNGISKNQLENSQRLCFKCTDLLPVITIKL